MSKLLLRTSPLVIVTLMRLDLVETVLEPGDKRRAATASHSLVTCR
ncbi:MAG: hypothetical protein ACREEY_06025 [Brevundimonas sp.]